MYSKYKNLPCPCIYNLQYPAAHVCAHLRVAPACGPVTFFAMFPSLYAPKNAPGTLCLQHSLQRTSYFSASSRGSIRRRFASPVKKMAMKNCHFIYCRFVLPSVKKKQYINAILYIIENKCNWTENQYFVTKNSHPAFNRYNYKFKF